MCIYREREFFIDNLLVRIHRCFWCAGLAPWEFESSFPGSLTSTFLVCIYLYLSIYVYICIQTFHKYI